MQKRPAVIRVSTPRSAAVYHKSLAALPRGLLVWSPVRLFRRQSTVACRDTALASTAAAARPRPPHGVRLRATCRLGKPSGMRAQVPQPRTRHSRLQCPDPHQNDSNADSSRSTALSTVRVIHTLRRTVNKDHSRPHCTLSTAQRGIGMHEYGALYSSPRPPFSADLTSSKFPACAHQAVRAMTPTRTYTWPSRGVSRPAAPEDCSVLL